MARFKYAFDEAKNQRYIKEKRGKGEGGNYRPWLTIQDVPSSGRVHRIPSTKSNRLHHALSDLEKYSFLFYDWKDEVIDIREQYPLDREITRRIAQECGIKHPQDPDTGCDIVMTTDFLITTFVNGEQKLAARAVKPSDQLTNRVIEKLELERRYWKELKTDWGIITDNELPTSQALALDWARNVFDFRGLDQPDANFWQDTCARILEGLSKYQTISLKELSEMLAMDTGVVITAVRHLVWHKHISLDMTKPFSLETAIPEIIIKLPVTVRRSA